MNKKKKQLVEMTGKVWTSTVGYASLKRARAIVSWSGEPMR